MYFYRVSALLVASEIELPCIVALPADHGEADVIIRRTPAPTALPGACAGGPNWQIAGEQLLLRIPNVARILIRSGAEIEFEPEGRTPFEDVAAFLVGAAFAILLQQRGQIVLRASAVRVGNRAALFCGISGAGKSTIAMALGQRGYPLVSDDICTFSPASPEAPMIDPDGREPGLWGDAIRGLDLAHRQGRPLRADLAKFHVGLHDNCATPLKLGVVYMLREAQLPRSEGIERTKAADVTPLFFGSAYHPRLVTALAQQAGYFHSATTLAAEGRMFVLKRPLELARLPTLVSRLEDHWRAIGLDGGRA